MSALNSWQRRRAGHRMAVDRTRSPRAAFWTVWILAVIVAGCSTGGRGGPAGAVPGTSGMLSEAEISRIPKEHRSAVLAALARAGDNWPEMAFALRNAEDAHVEAVAFLVANMPDRDLASLKGAFILENVELAYKAREETPWGKGIPDEIFLNDVLPYASLNERRDDWRRDFYERFLPVVRDCKTAGEAAVKINAEAFQMLGVEYHATKRPKPDQSPYETMEAKYASCTGLTIIVVDACRAVGIPMRVAGTPSWTTKRGNHTWSEVWDGQWRFMDGAGLNKGWLAADAAKADPTDPMHCIYASSFKKTPIHFPLVWDRSLKCVNAVDVTPFYLGRQKVEIQVLDKPGGKPVAADVVLCLDGSVYAKGSTQTGSNDGGTLRFELPANQEFEVHIAAAGKPKAARGTLRTTQDPERRTTFFLKEQLIHENR